MGVGDGVGLQSRPRSHSSSACTEFISKNVILPTSSRNSRLYARLKTGRRDEDVQNHCDLQDKKHENTILSGEREAAACARAAMLESQLHAPSKLATSVALCCVIKLHILEWPFIVASLRHTCAIIMLSNQHLDMPHL